jgi:hypothetical protein
MLVGTTAAAKAAPDGYTLLAGLTGNMSVNSSLFAKLPYDPLADFTPVAMLANYPFLIVVNNNLPPKSIKELIAFLKSQPGKIDYASAGNGTPGSGSGRPRGRRSRSSIDFTPKCRRRSPIQPSGSASPTRRASRRSWRTKTSSRSCVPRSPNGPRSSSAQG